jgi:hypothetical protein
MFRFVIALSSLLVAVGTNAIPANSSGAEAFNQLGQTLPTPNVYRTASGAPGEKYWQQQVDYQIKASLDEEKRRITATSTITYHNESPDTLRYLWLQMDQNRFKNDSLDRRSRTVTGKDQISYGELRMRQSAADTEHGYQNVKVTDARGVALPFTIVDTLMRIDLPQPLISGAKTEFKVDWEFNIINEEAIGGRGGYEYFEENDTELFFLAQRLSTSWGKHFLRPTCTAPHRAHPVKSTGNSKSTIRLRQVSTRKNAESRRHRTSPITMNRPIVCATCGYRWTKTASRTIHWTVARAR